MNFKTLVLGASLKEGETDGVNVGILEGRYVGLLEGCLVGLVLVGENDGNIDG